ncbi:MAG: hypothetical protein ACR2NQ_06555 [Thermodesulfobacteriota bacterium]
MKTVKQRVQSILDNLPDDCSLEDVQYQIYATEKIRKGLARSEAGETLTQEEVEKKFSKRLSPV